MRIVRKPYAELRIPYSRFKRFMRMIIREIRECDPTDSEYIKDLANTLRQYIYECGYRPTGYTSHAALTSKNTTLEHFHSRLGYAKRIIKLINSQRFIDSEESYRRLYNMVKSASRVHCTTPEENRRLSRIQNDPRYSHLSWRVQYRLAGIVLIYTANIFHIDNVEYRGYTKTDMLSILDVSIYTFDKRLKDPRYPWHQA
jgi:hypothetical protein